MPGMKQRIKDGVSLFLLRHSRFFDASWYRKQAGIPENADAAAHYYRGGWRSAEYRNTLTFTSGRIARALAAMRFQKSR